MEYGTPSTPEEIAACESSPSGVICMLRDLGSKFGTFVQVDEDLINATTPRTSNTDGAAKEGSGDETGDETDDEGVNNTSINYATLSDGQVQAVRLLCNKNNGSSSSSLATTPKFQKVEPNKSVTLLPLSHSTTTSSSSPPHIIILFGAVGSAIRLTLLPLQFTFSSITPKSTLQSYIDSLHYIGASHNQWDVNQSTHLVALEKKANAKAITAWASGRKSVVTLEYIDGLLGRKELGDVLPREEDYPPKGTSQLDSLSYSGDHSRALQGYCIAVMMEDDNGPLAQSAGAKILKVYDAPDSSQADFNNWWNTQQQAAIDDKMVLVLVDSKSSKCKPYNTWLHKRNDVRLTSAKHLAQAITGNNGEGDLLLDAKKEAIEKMEGWDAVMENASAKEAVKGAEDMETSKLADDAKVVQEEKEQQPKQKEAIQDEAPPVHAGEKRTKQKVVTEEVANNEQPEERPPEKKRRRKEQPKESAQQEDNAMETEPVEESRDVSFDANMNPQSDEEELGLPEERIPLPTTSDGWFVAAPKSRKAYRKAIDDTEAEGPLVAAETQKVSGLVVRAYVKPAATARPGRSVRRGKDFKRFRKNHIIRGFSSSEPKYADYNSSSHNATLPTIRLVSVLPKESERQRQLEMQTRELERENEIADNLFNDTGGGGGGKRGRKSGNNSMYQYLSQQTTTKKGRGRR
eukprot:scaffold8186_cov132-Skeletonema_dohrnii-CCMP3373.AAC.4